jgi:outer membrane protein assembly factor BamB
MRVCALLLILACTLPAQGDTIYAALTNGDILAVDTEHGTSTLVAHTFKSWFDIAFAPDGRLYGSDGNRLYLIDPFSGQPSLVGEFETFINGLTFVGETLYGSGSIWLYTVDRTTGAAQSVGTMNYGSSGDLQWFQGALYMTAFTPWNDQLVRLDPASGRAELVGDIGFRSVYGLAASSSEMYGLTLAGDLLKIDTQTGAGTALGRTGGMVNGASSKPPQVPEPSALLLLSTGLAAIGLRLRRCSHPVAHETRDEGEAA